MEVLGVFEGGGARGFAHVGALRATERRGLSFRAVAGTSIGAIIASLVAAGYRSDELFSVDPASGEEHGLLALDLEAILLDPAEYTRVNRLKSHLQGKKGGALVRWFLNGFKRTWLAALFLPDISVLAYFFHRKIIKDIWTRSGAVGSERLRDWLNEQLAAKLRLPKGTRVRFKDLPISLRVVTTNLSTCDIQVFGSENTPDVEVAHAVSASAAFPFFFRPVRIGDHMFVDGGLVSNAPAWLLDDIRANSSILLHTFNFKLLEPEEDVLDTVWPRTEETRLLPFSRRLIPSSLNSRFALESRLIDDFHVPNLRSPVRTLDFDQIRGRRQELADLGEDGVSEYYRKNIGPRLRSEMEAGLRVYMDLVRELLFINGPLRASLVQRTSLGQARCVYAAGYTGDADEGMNFRVAEDTPAKVLELSEPILIRCKEIDANQSQSRLSRLANSIRPAEIKLVYSIPIFSDAAEWEKSSIHEREQPFAALVFQFNEIDDRLLLDPTFEDISSAIAQAIGTFWTDKPANATLSSTNWMAASDDWHALSSSGFYISKRKDRAPLDEEMLARLEAANRLTG